MHRLLFSKTADAIWTSHLDVMRIFQRAFLRAHIPIAHTQGYSPHPFVSVILPLSVGTASQCEILECTLEDKEISFQETQERLNQVLPEGIQVKEVYESSRKAKELTYLQARLELCYDSGIPSGASEMLNSLYSRETLEITKKSKKLTLKKEKIFKVKGHRIVKDQYMYQIGKNQYTQNLSYRWVIKK